MAQSPQQPDIAVTDAPVRRYGWIIAVIESHLQIAVTAVFQLIASMDG